MAKGLTTGSRNWAGGPASTRRPVPPATRRDGTGRLTLSVTPMCPSDSFGSVALAAQENEGLLRAEIAGGRVNIVAVPERPRRFGRRRLDCAAWDGDAGSGGVRPRPPESGFRADIEGLRVVACWPWSSSTSACPGSTAASPASTSSSSSRGFSSPGCCGGMWRPPAHPLLWCAGPPTAARRVCRAGGHRNRCRDPVTPHSRPARSSATGSPARGVPGVGRQGCPLLPASPCGGVSFDGVPQRRSASRARTGRRGA